ncbi:MAG: hypothetical protein ACK4VJ_02070 [Rhodoluna sp.]|jgi:hypothetical protein
MFSVRKTLTIIPTIAVMLIGLSACSTPEAKPSPDPTNTKTQAQIEAEFLAIAADSCAKAQTENIVEKVGDGSKIIALAKSNAYQDYSAVYFDPSGKPQVIYEMELSVCSPGYLISMMEEANQTNSGDYKHSIKLNADGTYTWSQRVWGEEENFMQDTIFTVAEGIITAADGEAYDYTFEYGPISDEEMVAFKAAIDAEIERLSE